MSKQSVKPVLLSEAQIQAIRNIQEQQRQQSGIGVAPTIHEIARDWWIKPYSNIWGKGLNTFSVRMNQPSIYYSYRYLTF